MIRVLAVAVLAFACTTVYNELPFYMMVDGIVRNIYRGIPKEEDAFIWTSYVDLRQQCLRHECNTFCYKSLTGECEEVMK